MPCLIKRHVIKRRAGVTKSKTSVSEARPTLELQIQIALQQRINLDSDL